MAVASIPRETPVLAGVENIPVDRIMPGPNVRADVGDLAELAESIKQHGILQPIRVRHAPIGTVASYELQWGQRRLAAAKLAGLTHVPAMVDFGKPPSETTRSIEQLVENLQRQDLNPLEEAKAFRAILDADTGLTQAELAKQVGRSAPYVSNALRILELDKKVLPLVESGQLSGAHAKALASLKGKAQRDYAEKTVATGWSAHETERQVQWFHEGQKEDAARAAKLATWAEKVAEPALTAKGADKATSVLTTTDGYGYNGSSEVLAALKARGWKVGPTASWSRGKCDCDAYGVNRTYEGNAQVVRRCIVQAHYQEKLKAEGKRESVSWQERSRLDALERAMRERLHEAVKPVFVDAFRKLPPDVARILLWAVMDYSLNDWVREHKGDRKKPDAWAELAEQSSGELAGQLVGFVFRHFDSRYNVKLDLSAIAQSFGVSIEQPAEKKPAKAKKGGK